MPEEISKVNLFLYVTSQHVYKVDIKHCYLLERDWQESSVTWNAPWQSPGGAFSEPPVFTNTNTVKNVWEEFDVTDAVLDMINNQKPNYGFIIAFPSTSNKSRAAYYRSSEYSGDKSLRPKLVIYSGATDIADKNDGMSDFICKSESGGMRLRFPESLNEKVTVMTLTGREVASFITDGRKTWYLLSGSISTGIHIVSVKNTRTMVVKKLWFINK